MAKNEIGILITAKDLTKGVFRKLNASLGLVRRSIFSLKAGLVSVAGAAGLGLLVKSSLQSIDTLGKTASKLGVTSQALQKLRFASQLAGVETRTVDMAVQRFTRRLSEAAQNTGEAKDALKELGLNAKELSKQRSTIKLPTFDNRARERTCADVDRQLQNLAGRLAVAMRELRDLQSQMHIRGVDNMWDTGGLFIDVVSIPVFIRRLSEIKDYVRNLRSARRNATEASARLQFRDIIDGLDAAFAIRQIGSTARRMGEFNQEMLPMRNRYYAIVRNVNGMVDIARRVEREYFDNGCINSLLRGRIDESPRLRGRFHDHD